MTDTNKSSSRLNELLSKDNLDSQNLFEAMVLFTGFLKQGKVDLMKDYKSKMNSKWGDNPVYMNEGFMDVVNGISAFYLSDYPKAINHLQKAIETVKYDNLRGVAHMALGANYRSTGEIDVSVQHFIMAESLLAKSDYFKEYYTYVYYQLGEIYFGIGEYDIAKEYYNKGIQSFDEELRAAFKFRLQNGVGLSLLKLGKQNEALRILKEALENDQLSLADQGRGYCDLGSAYREIGDYSHAEELLTKSLKIREENNLLDASSTSMIELSKLYLDQHRVDEAMILLEKGMSISIQFNSDLKRMAIEQLLAEAHFKKENWEKAAQAYRLSLKSSSEILTKQEHGIFKLKNAQIESQRKELAEKNNQLEATLNEIASLRRSRKSLIFSITTGIILVLLTELFLDPVIEEVSYNNIISLMAKVIIALMLKPMESLYERILFNRALKSRSE